MRRALILAFVLAFATGCPANIDPKDPEGAYNLYVAALEGKNPEAVWNRCAPSTHAYFQGQYDTLVKMDDTIGKYLPPTDHKIAREQAGSILTSKVKDGKSLFLEVFKPERIQFAEKHRVGSVVDQIKISEDETAAELTTLGKDTFYLQRGDNEEWFVMLVRSSSAVEKQMGWLTANESALNQTIEDLIAEERQEREAVIEELMKLAPSESPEAPTEGGEDAAEGQPTDDAAAATTNDGSDGGQEENPGNNGP